MRVLIFGANGMFGHKLYQRLKDDFDVSATLRGSFAAVARFGIFDLDGIVENVDVADRVSVERVISMVQPDVVINAVGIIKQAPEASNVIQTLTANSIFPHVL